jgi:hypothetical protein
VWQQKVFTKFLGMNYMIDYRKGAENRAVDAISQRFEEPGGWRVPAALLGSGVRPPAWG